MGLKCPFCAAVETKVVDKRPTPDMEMNRRRRECIKCKKRFTTYEQVQKLGLQVLKKNGGTEPFIREKIKNGLLKACEKRPISEEKIDAVVDWIEQKILKSPTMKVKSSYIGELVMKKLKMLDSIAYLRFASVYRSFDDIKSFERELKQIKNLR
jgi:transcriptional repressor NrdR